MKGLLSILVGFAALLVVAGSVPIAHAAKSPAMESCSAEWKKMKDAGKIRSGETWPKFWSKCAKDYAEAHPEQGATEESAPAASPTTSKRTVASKPSAVDESDTAGSGAQKKECDAKWSDYKSRTGAHGWHDYFQFMSKCL